MMTEYAFFANKADRWRKNMASLWGNFNICPCLYQHELPCHSPVELFSMSSFKVWGNIQEPHHDITYHLVWIESATEDRQYGISIVWVSPNQARAATMEEVVERLTAYPSSRTDWPYTLAQLYEGSCHAPLPKDKHLGILPQGKVEETYCGQISQLKVCQLLSASPQVVYPIGLNGHIEPIITTLPEPLDSSISIITSKHLYLGIDIPSPPMEESDCKVPPLSEISTVLITSSPKSPPKFEGSMTAEVKDLLAQAVQEVSSSESEHPPGKPTTAAVPMTPPRKSEASLQPVDTSSQASVEEAEASLEDLPANISPIAAAYCSRSISPPVDPSQLQANANRAVDSMLHLKRSIDIRRQRAVWELGVMLCQNESQEATSVTEAKVIHSQATLDAQTTCSQSILKPKTNYLAVVKEAKTIRGHMVQEADAAYSKTIYKAEAWKISQAVILHKEHGRYMQGLEEEAFREESGSHHDFLSSSQVTPYHSPQPLKGALAASYHILLGQTPLLPPLILPQKNPPMEEQPTTATPPSPMPKWYPRPKR